MLRVVDSGTGQTLRSPRSSAKSQRCRTSSDQIGNAACKAHGTPFARSRIASHQYVMFCTLALASFYPLAPSYRTFDLDLMAVGMVVPGNAV